MCTIEQKKVHMIPQGTVGIGIIGVYHKELNVHTEFQHMNYIQRKTNGEGGGAEELIVRVTT